MHSTSEVRMFLGYNIFAGPHNLKGLNEDATTDKSDLFILHLRVGISSDIIQRKKSRHCRGGLHTCCALVELTYLHIFLSCICNIKLQKVQKCNLCLEETNSKRDTFIKY